MPKRGNWASRSQRWNWENLAGKTRSSAPDRGMAGIRAKKWNFHQGEKVKLRVNPSRGDLNQDRRPEETAKKTARAKTRADCLLLCDGERGPSGQLSKRGWFHEGRPWVLRLPLAGANNSTTGPEVASPSPKKKKKKKNKGRFVPFGLSKKKMGLMETRPRSQLKTGDLHPRVLTRFGRGREGWEAVCPGRRAQEREAKRHSCKSREGRGRQTTGVRKSGP